MHEMHVEYIAINILHKTHKIFTNGKTILEKNSLKSFVYISTC